MKPCIIWGGRLDPDGYAMEGRCTRVARRVYADAHGPIPSGYEIDHTCNERACVEIAHLQALTDAEHKAVTMARMTACRAGHQWSELTTRIDSAGKRHCRPCEARHAREYRARQKAS